MTQEINCAEVGGEVGIQRHSLGKDNLKCNMKSDTNETWAFQSTNKENPVKFISLFFFPSWFGRKDCCWGVPRPPTDPLISIFIISLRPGQGPVYIHTRWSGHQIATNEKNVSRSGFVICGWRGVKYKRSLSRKREVYISITRSYMPSNPPCGSLYFFISFHSYLISGHDGCKKGVPLLHPRDQPGLVREEN